VACPYNLIARFLRLIEYICAYVYIYIYIYIYLTRVNIYKVAGLK